MLLVLLKQRKRSDPGDPVNPHPFLLANRLVRGSYVSLQSALAHHGLIPEHVPVVTSVTTLRPGRRKTPLGDFEYRHIKPGFFHGFVVVEVGEGQQAFVAGQEKALLDLLYLSPSSDSAEFVGELRLQNLERLDLEMLARLAVASGRPRLLTAAAIVEEVARQKAGEYEGL